MAVNPAKANQITEAQTTRLDGRGLLLGMLSRVQTHGKRE
jgi:hypothetical protein